MTPVVFREPFVVRRLLSALSVVAAVPVLIAVPVTARPTPAPHPVAPHITSLAVPSAAAHPGPAGSRVALLADTGERRTDRFDLVGATWPAGSLAAGAAVQVRVHQEGGWTGWSALSRPDGGPDAGSADARRAGARGETSAEPLWVGGADGVQARVVSSGHRSTQSPAGLRVVLVDGGSSDADAHPGPSVPLGTDVAAAAAGRPTIYTRAQWGADESLRQRACSGGPSYGSTITMGFIHHTDNANGYSQSQVPSIIRSIYAYHVNSNGWCDIGYNYLVDRFGRIWEGRYGGITRPVIGAHTGGFNTDTFGVSLIGNFSSTAPSSAMLGAVERLFAWRLGSYYRDPLGRTTVTAGSFSGSRYRTGQQVTFNTISGHRDADYTTCPGGSAYGDLAAIRRAVRKDMGSGFVAPRLSTRSIRMAGGRVLTSAGVINAVNWTLRVTGPAGDAVRTLTGTANRSTPISARWNLDDGSGTPVLPGTYTLSLTAKAADGSAARAFTQTVTVTPPVSLTVRTRVAFDRPVTATGTGRPNGSVGVKVTAGGVRTDLGTAAVGSDGRWRLSAPVTAAHDLIWSVTDGATGYVARRTTKVSPLIVDPKTTTLVRAGSPLAVSGTALPDDNGTVTLWTQPAGATSATAATAVPVDPDHGTWSTAFTPTAPTAYWMRDGRGLVSAKRLVYPVDPPTASAPTSGYAGRSVRVRGNAGHAPVAVTLQSRQGTVAWSTVRTVTTSTTGAFSLSLPIPNTPGTPLSWRVTTGYGRAVTGSVTVLATFKPTVTGPAAVHWNTTHALSGTAVPGDLVTVWTRNVGTTSWTQAGSTKASSAKQWSFPLTILRDIQWRATSRSGTSSTGQTVIAPSIYAPATVAAGTRIVVHGRAVPGLSLTLSRRPVDGTTWTAVRTVTVAADGGWSVAQRPSTSMRYRVASNGHRSRTITVTTG